MRITLAALLLGCLAAPPSLRASATEVFSWSSTAPAPVSVRIDVERGDIFVQPATGDQVEVSALKRGSAAELRNLTIAVEDHSRAIAIHTVRPRSALEASSPRASRASARVDFTIHLPPGVRFIGRTEIGNIEVRHATAPVRASTVVGDIRISTGSTASAQTTNGRIVAHLDLASSNGEKTSVFRTVNGDIEVTIPGSADATISATSTNGSFATDLFPVEGRRFGIPGARVRGRLGTGEHRIELDNVNGDLRLERRDH